jgi:hypothetical protein
MKKTLLLPLFIFLFSGAYATQLLIPMDESQTNHLRAYGITFNVLNRNEKAQWLLNYRGGSFLFEYNKEDVLNCMDKGVSYEILTEAQSADLMKEIDNPSNNMSAVNMERAPKIAVHCSPGVKLWDDPVTLVLRYAGIDFDTIYDEQIMQGQLKNYDWLHIHHDDFTGQHGRFYSGFSRSQWYMDAVASSETTAHQFGFQKTSLMQLAVAKQIRDFVSTGGFLFAMCSATDTYDIALAADGVDICDKVYDGDGADANMNSKLKYDNCFAFQNFQLKTNPFEYEFSNIDTYETRKTRGINESNDYFTLEDYSVITHKDLCMLTQNHKRTIKGFWGQTTGFDMPFIKPNVAIMGETKSINEARYIHGNFEKGSWTFYGGHDPEDYQHQVGENPTDISRYPNSPGYRLILDNVLFPSTVRKDAQAAMFKSYPNPVVNQFTLEYSLTNKNTTAVLYVYDVNGKEEFKQVLSPDVTSTTVDVSSLSTGTYLWKIISGDDVLHTAKFSVVR